MAGYIPAMDPHDHAEDPQVPPDPSRRGVPTGPAVPVLSVRYDTAETAFIGQLDRLVAAVGTASDRDLLAASRCRGWAAIDVVVHVRVGLQEMLGGVVAATDREPDRDAATYWSTYEPSERDGDDVDAILWTRRTASAYRRPRHALEHLRMAADAAALAVTGMTPGAVSFQGHVLAAGDFLATWAVELAVHHLDLGRDVAFGSPTTESLQLGRATVEALAGSALPAAWSDELCLLAGSGRTPPPEASRTPNALPVLG